MRIYVAVAAIVGAALTIPLAPAVGAAQAAAAPNITLPDMQVKVPTGTIFIGSDPETGHRTLRYTHLTWDSGPGPFELLPKYNPMTRTSTFTQGIYRSPSPGVWVRDHTVPVAATGVYVPPSYYQFPLVKFTLLDRNKDGSVGQTVAVSTKTDYCISGNSYIGGVSDTPDSTFIPSSNCHDPNAPLGWSVGWGDQYDHMDSGQPIDLTGIADGTYVLRGVVDPKHVLTETDRTNNVLDTVVTISGQTARVLSQTSPGVAPPTVALTGLTAGAHVSGTLTLQATASGAKPPVGTAAKPSITSVQFLLDGRPLGDPVTSAPWAYSWTIGSTPLGRHVLSAQATDANGSVGTAAPVAVTVVSSSPGGLAVDQSVTETGRGAQTTVGFATSVPGDTLLAFVAADGPPDGGQRATVSGAGLAWHLVRRVSGRPGDAEIWQAAAPTTLTAATVTSTLAQADFHQHLTVLALEGSAGIGATGGASAASGPPAVALTTRYANSLAYAVGNDWDRAVGRVPRIGQTLVSQTVDTRVGDTFWVQGTSTNRSPAGAKLVLGDLAPSGDQWNLAAVEVRANPHAPAPPPDVTAPRVSLINPTAGQILSGTVPVAAAASDDVDLASVRFLLDGKQLGPTDTAPPYVVGWNTTTVPEGRHVLAATATDSSGNVGVAKPVTVEVENPPDAYPCYIIQSRVTVHGRGTLTTSAFHTAQPGETLLAFVASDGPGGNTRQSATVSGSGLTWKLVRRANAQSGDAEIWTATAPTVLTGATVTATPAHSGYAQTLTVLALEGTDGVGASAAASAPTGGPGLTITTTKDASLVFAVGNDWDGAVGRTLPSGWVPLDQWVDPAAGDTFWSQYTGSPTGSEGSVVTVGATAPTTDRWNLAAVEIVNQTN